MSDPSFTRTASDSVSGKVSSVDITTRRAYPTGSLTQQEIDDKITFLRAVRHERFELALEVFQKRDCNVIESLFAYPLAEVVDISVKVFPLFTEVDLAAILGQVSQGLSFLESEGLRHSNFDESQVMTDLDGNVKIGGLFWCDRGETTPIQLLPLTNHLMYPWLYSESVEADVTKWRKDSAAIEFWKTIAIAKPTTSMTQLSDSPLLKLPWTTNNVKELVMLAFDHKRTEVMMKHDPPVIRRLLYPQTIDNTH